jgi:hypothetical protein
MIKSMPLAIALLGVVGAWTSIPASAQDTPPVAIKIAPGVYTTP